MATTFKTFLNSDIVTTKTLLHEAIPITGALVSGTYNGGKPNNTELNIKNYSHGMFQSVFDYPYLSSSANHIFDISVGFSTGSVLSGNIKQVKRTQQEKKIQIYNQMAQVLMGHDKDGNIRAFDQDGDTAGQNPLKGKIHEAFFLNFSRLLTKDEIKKGSFSMELGVDPRFRVEGDLRKNTGRTIIIKDTNAQNDYRVNSPAGEFGILSASSGQASGAIAHALAAQAGMPTSVGNIGLIFYQAGIVVLDARMFAQAVDTNAARFVEAGTTVGAGPDGDQIYQLTGGILNSASCIMVPQSKPINPTETEIRSKDVYALLTGSTIQTAANGLRHRIKKITFNNTTELNSSVYFCRAHHNEFNYSSNPTYLADSKIRVKNIATDMPISYVTSVGLYSSDNELLAVAKLSEPLRKDPTNELTLRVRLDY
tara:strand:- start:821 stop:2095 length:1275 start_codon:yes stop_codon:yes gene_type:complete